MANLKKTDSTSNFNIDTTRLDQKKGSSYFRERRKRRREKRTIFLSKIKRRALKHVWLVRLGIFVGVLLGIYIIFLSAGFLLINTKTATFLGITRDFIFTPERKTKSIEGRTNILILGKGGNGHEASELTDTVIFASVDHKTPSFTLISIPRDIWIPEIRAKLNSSYYWGEQKAEDGGIILAKSTVEQIVGTPVHYGFVINFSGFQQIIDEIGGIEIEVEQGFTDERYPISGREEDECGGDPEFNCRYETVTFVKGMQFMDGEAALKFVRSRNAEGEEGTDLARAVRQQKVLNAIREKVLSLRVLVNPGKVSSILSIIRSSVETDIDPAAGAVLMRRLLSADDNISSEVLSEELLLNPPKSSFYDNLYVFIPRDETWAEVHEWIECVLENGNCE